MSYIYLGKITNTHGLKGEIRILSDFLKKEEVFKEGFNIYIGQNKIKEVIKSYRHHKQYEMITLEGINNIDEVLKYKGEKVYILKSDLNLACDEVLLEELKDYIIVNGNNKYGYVKDFYKTKNNILLYIQYNKNYYIPYMEEFIKSIDKVKKEILVPRVEELL